MHANNQPATAPNELLTELESLATDMKEMVSTSSTEAGSECLNRVRDRFSSVQQRFGEMYAGARKNVVAGARSTDTTIRENPYGALLIALGIGVGLGVLLGRSRSSNR